jgi:hypothetical protein
MDNGFIWSIINLCYLKHHGIGKMKDKSVNRIQQKMQKYTQYMNSQNIFDEVMRSVQWKMDSFFILLCCHSWIISTKWTWIHISSQHKNELKIDPISKLIVWIYKTSWRKHRKKSSKLVLGEDFIHMIQKSKIIIEQIYKLDFIKIWNSFS